MGVDDVVAQTTAGAGVGIVSLDSGIEIDHPDLAANIPADFCIADLIGRSNCADGNGHGTIVAGVMVADFNEAEKHALFYGTAEKVYRLADK